MASQTGQSKAFKNPEGTDAKIVSTKKGSGGITASLKPRKSLTGAAVGGIKRRPK